MPLSDMSSRYISKPGSYGNILYLCSLHESDIVFLLDQWHSSIIFQKTVQ